MRRDGEWARAKFTEARVARLATVDQTGRPHLVPITFAAVRESLYTAVDAKPKTSTRLRRLANIAANPQVSVLVDHYADDWDELWWARADGTARILDVAGSPDLTGDVRHALAALADRYPAYRTAPPSGPLVAVDVRRWSGWSAR
jgi:PPOX class probable F420-dependent enzyme